MSDLVHRTVASNHRIAKHQPPASNPDSDPQRLKLINALRVVDRIRKIPFAVGTLQNCMGHLLTHLRWCVSKLYLPAVQQYGTNFSSKTTIGLQLEWMGG